MAKPPGSDHQDRKPSRNPQLYASRLASLPPW